MTKKKNYRTIGEAAVELELPQHVLRYWETQFSQVTPIKPADNRRYYDDTMMHLLSSIKKLLYEDGYTIKGAQKIIHQIAPPKQASAEESAEESMSLSPHEAEKETSRQLQSVIQQLKTIREQLKQP